MNTIKWDFPLLGTGNEQGYSNAGIETFKGTELIDNLAREICQNSLDAKQSVDVPVIVSFSLKSPPFTNNCTCFHRYFQRTEFGIPVYIWYTSKQVDFRQKFTARL